MEWQRGEESGGPARSRPDVDADQVAAVTDRELCTGDDRAKARRRDIRSVTAGKRARGIRGGILQAQLITSNLKAEQGGDEHQGDGGKDRGELRRYAPPLVNISHRR